ncbi:DUF3008 family protein [Burkholderia pseudomallei]|uniref:DUF3008 family protein n=1 Tax=Burkholderia pseudomallei TaxID=28450 RepID=UPI0008FF6D91|nr:DUF3008 family protein [Burkholderia pseudomallei]APD38938.1 DUF3008 domain-containing protein [Burkholderia pseudomallei]ARK43516.1 DUF3008 domain-containing protein [Burkholderia pseudomallei]ARL56522.1 DUF3008 domain-containing protein [Burkholderia pseudomallei]ARL64824.1 DUF3008 domain-containing protein [Burkholderia pseudomallei]
MPAKSQAQQRAAGAALSTKRGRTKASELKRPSKSMYSSMSEKELEKLAGTKTRDKPKHKSKS